MEQMTWTMRAVYLDAEGEYTCPVVKTPDGWRLQAPAGNIPIEFYLLSADNRVIEFVEYRLDAPKGIRPVDYFQVLNALLVQLPNPQRPADPPQTPTAAADTALHIDTADGDSFQQLQAAGARAYAQQLTERERERRRIQETNQHNSQTAQLAQAARHIRNHYAAAMTKTIGEK